MQRTLDNDVNNESEDHNTSERKAWIFTSATLGNDARLSWFTDSSVLRGAKVLQVESPFDYHHQAGVYVPQPFAAAGSVQHSLQVAQLVLDAAQRIGGRTLVLTTTLKALHAISESLRSALGLFADLDVLVQGEAPQIGADSALYGCRCQPVASAAGKDSGGVSHVLGRRGSAWRSAAAWW